jgi:hypothetical protein
VPENDPSLITIFTAALERTDPAARGAYLDSACGGDATLRQRVKALLAAHDGGGQPVAGDPTGNFEATSAETLDGPRAPTWKRLCRRN